MKARAKFLLATALLMGSAAACSDLTGVNARADGVYFLQTVNGTSVPYSFTDNNTGHTITVTSDTYSINSDGTYSDQQLYREDTGTQVLNKSFTESGTWVQNSNVITFTPTQSSINDFSLYQGTITNSNAFGGTRILTISINNSTAVYSE
jgi:uncharacterized lipoprotein NlpE involved in copper resistance